MVVYVCAFIFLDDQLSFVWLIKVNIFKNIIIYKIFL
jgi:hypothetical protein